MLSRLAMLLMALRNVLRSTRSRIAPPLLVGGLGDHSPGPLLIRIGDVVEAGGGGVAELERPFQPEHGPAAAAAAHGDAEAGDAVLTFLATTALRAADANATLIAQASGVPAASAAVVQSVEMPSVGPGGAVPMERCQGL